MLYTIQSPRKPWSAPLPGFSCEGQRGCVSCELSQEMSVYVWFLRFTFNAYTFSNADLCKGQGTARCHPLSLTSTPCSVVGEGRREGSRVVTPTVMGLYLQIFSAGMVARPSCILPSHSPGPSPSSAITPVFQICFSAPSLQLENASHKTASLGP